MRIIGGRFRGTAQDIRITLSTRSSPQIMNLVAAQNFDLGFCDTPQGGLHSELVQDETTFCDCLCAMSVGHPLADRDSISAQDLDGEPMGVLPPGHSSFRNTQLAFEKSGAELNVSVDAQYFLPLLHFVEAGQICAIVDPLSAESYCRMKGEQGRIRFVRFTPAVPFGYSLVTPRQSPPSLLVQEFASRWRAFVDEIIASTRQQAE